MVSRKKNKIKSGQGSQREARYPDRMQHSKVKTLLPCSRKNSMFTEYLFWKKGKLREIYLLLIGNSAILRQGL
jgi:hypothetical protein